MEEPPAKSIDSLSVIIIMCDELVELKLWDFYGFVIVPCWAILEPEVKGKISSTDSVSIESFDILFIIDFVCINPDI